MLKAWKTSQDGDCCEIALFTRRDNQRRSNQVGEELEKEADQRK